MKVGSFRRDAKAMRDGEWVSPGPEFDDVEIKTRAMLPAYHDKLAALRAREARRVGGEAKIGMEFMNRAIVDCLIECCLLDIRGLTHDSEPGEPVVPVMFEEFVEMIKDPGYAELAAMAVQATAQVGRARDEDLQDAVGNLRPALVKS
jgi:hypothetical protein